MSEPQARPVVLVTGLSGAGKTSALKILEDLDHEAVDNLPLSLLETVVHADIREGPLRPLALCIDSRTRGFDTNQFEQYVAPLLDDPARDITMLFLDCEDEVLRRRFTETRRRHPLAHDRPVNDGIRRERELLMWFRMRADVTIDTSGLANHDLRAMIRARFDRKGGRRLAVFVTSFAYRNGLPPEADLVFDVRFLANPYYVEDLREGTGLDAVVGAYVAADPTFEPFFDAVVSLLSALLPAYEREGKSYLTIAVGCTGGRHRSVFVAERLAETLKGPDHSVDIRHRDIGARSHGAAPVKRARKSKRQVGKNT